MPDTLHLNKDTNDNTAILSYAADQKTIQTLLRNSSLAGDTLRRAGFARDAHPLLCYKKVLLNLKAVKDEQTDGLFIDAALKFARILTDANEPHDTIYEVLDKAINRAKRTNDQPSEVHLKIHLGEYRWYQGFGLLNGLLSHCKDLKSQANITKVALHLALSFIEIGDIEKTMPILR